MATFTRIKSKNQSCGRMLGALAYVLQDKKVRFKGARVTSGVGCLPVTSYLEMMTTKQRFKKMDGVCFYHFVQSFSERENIQFTLSLSMDPAVTGGEITKYMI